jgi:ABC-type transport system substrate-binding protein
VVRTQVHEEASVSQSTTTPTVSRVSRRGFLRASALSSAALGLLACAPQSPSQPAPKTETKPAEPAKPAAPAAATQAPAAPAKPAEPAKPAAPAAATQAPAAAAKPAEAAKPAAKPGEEPRRGGELVFAVSAEPDTFDGHKSTTFANIHPVAPHYNTLVKFDPEGYPKIIGDLAESWTTSPDGLTMTFKVRSGVNFHDGSPFSSKDVKASYDRIINPPQGVVSARKQGFAAFASVEAPDPTTVVFKLKYASPGALQMLCTPYSYVYSAAARE